MEHALYTPNETTARLGATWPKYYLVAVIPRGRKIQNWAHGSQVWARE